MLYFAAGFSGRSYHRSSLRTWVGYFRVLLRLNS